MRLLDRMALVHSVPNSKLFLMSLTLLGLVLPSASALAQSPIKSCNDDPQPPFCSAVRGDRSTGWLSQTRSEVMAQHGIVATSQPLAAEAGLQILKRGGNAIDAAVATAATLNLVEPMNVGIAGDLFAIIYIASGPDAGLHVLNASGKAPSGATLQHYNQLGFFWDPNNWGPGSGMPGAGIYSVTVPGAAWGWDEVVRRYGNLTVWEDMQPAIHYAENGFPVSERISNDWNLPNALPSAFPCCTMRDPDSVQTWYINGQKPAPGQIYKNPDLARTFRIFAERGREGFYTGQVAQAIVRKSTMLGGTMTMADLANYRGEWVEPAHTEYHGIDLFELPPPSQAWNTTEILNILDMCVPEWSGGQTLADLGPTNPQYWHFIAEAKKMAYWDQYKVNADPDFVTVPLGTLISKKYAATLCSKVDPNRAGCLTADQGLVPCPQKKSKTAKVSLEGDTIVLATADRWGNMVSWVNSNFAGFGSGVTVPGYGFVLHNRGSLFTLDPSSPNLIAPQKRPYNTLSAGFVMQNNRPLMTITLMGGDMQAQGHAQTLVNIIDLGANVQAATDMARFHHNEVMNQLQLESQLFNLVGAQLAKMGHDVQSISGGGVGGFQSIIVTNPDDPSTRFYRAGSDHRKDGLAIGW
jgi:gamma-glutamyltranspeptidase / glutathione hydrolase